MGILNVTPDSFSDGGKYYTAEKAAERALEIERLGADIVDIGAESTRPDAREIPAEEELARILPVLDLIQSKISVPVSVDTTKAAVAKACIERGASIINDVSGLAASGQAMADLARKTGAGLVLMHRRGTPATMQKLAVYGDVAEEVACELEETVEKARQWDVPAEQIAVDPGIGFAKTAEQNFEMLKHFEKFTRLGYPVLAGPSRKSFLNVTGKPAAERDWATAAAVTAAVLKGARIMRVHEVAAMKEVVRTADNIIAGGDKKHVRA